MGNKKRLTVNVDAELITAAKRHAREQGVSLSSLVEESLREMAGNGKSAEHRSAKSSVGEQPTDDAVDAGTAFIERWAGKFRPAERHGDPRYEHLAKKYDL